MNTNPCVLAKHRCLSGYASRSAGARLASLTRVAFGAQNGCPVNLPRRCRSVLETRPPTRLRSRQLGSGCRCEANIQNRELVVGDCLCLLCFCLYKQVTALILMPTFPGWLAPLSFNATRFFEFFSFAATVCGTWFACAWLLGGYRTTATADLQTALQRTILIWLLSEPVAAAQLVLLTAAEGKSLVGVDGFAAILPLAASGPGEPFVTAAGVLGLMSVWRTFYAAYLDFWNFQSMSGSPLNRYDDMRNFVDSLRASMLISIVFCVLVTYLAQFVGEENMRLLLDMAFQQPRV